MEHRVNTGIAIVLFCSLALACSFLRPKPPLNWHVTLEVDKSLPDLQTATNQAVRVLETRLDALGVSNFEVRALGSPPDGRILVNLPKVADRERLKKLLSAEGRLEIAHVISPPSPAAFQTYASKQDAEASLGGTMPSNRRVLPYSERSDQIPGDKTSPSVEAHEKWVVVESPAIVDGTDLRDARAMPGDSGSGTYNIYFALKPAGAQKFGEWTGANINEYMAVILNGEVKSVAYIKSPISDAGEISGRFTRLSAEDLALVLRSGALPKVKIVEEGPNN